jgi:hypothetical protein
MEYSVKRFVSEGIAAAIERQCRQNHEGKRWVFELAETQSTKPHHSINVENDNVQSVPMMPFAHATSFEGR